MARPRSCSCCVPPARKRRRDGSPPKRRLAVPCRTSAAAAVGADSETDNRSVGREPGGRKADACRQTSAHETACQGGDRHPGPPIQRFGARPLALASIFWAKIPLSWQHAWTRASRA
eukprot:177509-Prymnesium_polylepis.1